MNVEFKKIVSDINRYTFSERYDGVWSTYKNDSSNSFVMVIGSRIFSLPISLIISVQKHVLKEILESLYNRRCVADFGITCHCPDKMCVVRSVLSR